jgi:methyl-accepting chemotaxis protein
MEQLANQSRLIGDIINTVDDLSQQSNLLAINASIEAAKAGEQGKGCAVVAEEVKNLSQQSKDATSSVRGILNEIVKATSASTRVIEQGSKAVDAGHQEASNAGSVIKALTDNIEKSSRATEVIEESSLQQVIGLQQVVSAMESIRASSQRNLENANRLESAGKELTELGRRLVDLTRDSREEQEQAKQLV